MIERLAGIVAATIALVATAAAGWFLHETPGVIFSSGEPPQVASIPVPDEDLLITVEPGASPHDIGNQLAANDIVRSARLFRVLVALMGASGSLEAGEYEFARGTPAVEAVRRIADGKTASRAVTIPEGLRTEEIAELLDEQGIVGRDEFLAALSEARVEADQPFLQQIASEDLQGYVFPARYEFFRQASAADVAETLLRGFQTNIVDAIQLEGQTLSLAEIVTLASVVEREAATAEERPVIASVFLNRLRFGIGLQADPTVQFALAADPLSVSQYGWWKKELTLDDLKIDSPYNTYASQGLPPGPICNPGADAVRAVIRPARTSYLFFVAKEDGTHVFAETLEEHLANVDMYQR
jgi:UPF0755 protein